MHALAPKDFFYKKTSTPLIHINLNLKSCWRCQIKFKENEFSSEEVLEISFDTHEKAFEVSKICRDILELKGKGENKSLWSNCAFFSKDHLNLLRQSLNQRKDELTTLEDNIEPQCLSIRISNELIVEPNDEGFVLISNNIQTNSNHVNSLDSDSNDSACVTLSYDCNESCFEFGSEDVLPMNDEVEIDEMRRNKVWWVFNDSIFKRNRIITDKIRAQITNYTAFGFHEINPKLFSIFLKNVQEQFYWDTDYYINPYTGKYYFTYHLELMWGIFSEEQIGRTRVHVEEQKSAEPILWNEEYVVEMARAKKKLRKPDDYI
jgi:hypothetical protein